MSPHQQSSGAKAEAVAADGEDETAAPPGRSAPAERTASSAAEPKRAEPVRAESGRPEPEQAADPDGDDAQSGGSAASASASRGKRVLPPEDWPPRDEAPGTAAATAGAAAAAEPEEESAAAVGMATARPDGRTATAADRTRPRKPVLAGAAILGAALIAIPLLVAGNSGDDGPGDNPRGLTAGGEDTVLNPGSDPVGLYDSRTDQPSSSPSKAKPKKTGAPAASATSVPPSSARSSAPASGEATKKSASKPNQESKSKANARSKADPKPNWSTETVRAVSVLEVNQAWTTNRIRMVMQTDGNLVVYNEKNKPIWASMTFGSNHRAIFQADGNLVIHNASDRPIWAAGSHGNSGARLVLRVDAKVVIMNGSRVVWST